MRFIESDIALSDLRLLMDIKRETSNSILQELANKGNLVENQLELQSVDVLKTSGIFLESDIKQDIENIQEND